jgi:hypothetical protein
LSSEKRIFKFPALLFLAACSVLLTGCATAALDRARTDFYAGRLAEAGAALRDTGTTGNNRVLVLLERGTIYQAMGDYEASARDFIEASDELEKMAAISVSKDTGSMVINDSVQDFRGAPYERTLLHALAALDHFAVGHWENAAVEARRIIRSLEPQVKGDYPDDAFSRYLAGFALEMMDDRSNAALQYRLAAGLSRHADIDDATGRLSSKDKNPAAAPSDDKAELVCFFLLGRSPRGADVLQKNWRPESELYAEIQSGGRALGRSYALADTVDLAFTTEQKDAAAKLVKTVTRVAIKEQIAQGAGQNNDGLTELIRFVLIGLLEQPDVRRWETLPRWLQVARVPCPQDLKSFDAVLRNAAGVELRRVTVTQPIQRRRDTFVSFYRNLPAPR